MPFLPLALIAEVTHRCPLHCVYCSNPMQLAGTASELSTAEWISVFDQAGKLGMLHAHFTGGEPLARTDLVDLISAARHAGLYTNLITSGLGLNQQRLQTLVDGVDIQSKKVKFLRRIPVDPMTGSADWGLRSMKDDPTSDTYSGDSVFDVHSKSPGTALDGTKYSDW